MALLPRAAADSGELVTTIVCDLRWKNKRKTKIGAHLFGAENGRKRFAEISAAAFPFARRHGIIKLYQCLIVGAIYVIKE
ncbi:MAG TPA: hypothetical protein IAA32_01795 [Candidatus Butyricicoccus stercorigallinarum]|nr:hypothetical protein [Candidatus Butyricicoccus stercorigallinarum]